MASGQDALRIERHLEKVGLPTKIKAIPGWSAGSEDILDAMAQDKKVKKGRLTFILARGIGESFIAPDIDSGDVRSFLDEYLAS